MAKSVKPSKPETPGCDPDDAGYLAAGQGWSDEPPVWLPGHTEAYRLEWAKGYQVWVSEHGEKK